MTKRVKQLNFRQRAFVKAYLSDDPITGGNATQSYKKVYGSTCTERSIQTMGSKMLKQPRIAAMLEQAASKAIEEINWNAKKVLEQSVRLYDRCMGDTSYPVTVEYIDKDTHEPAVSTVQRSDYNPAGARSALELIGRNRGIQAFQDNVEVSHTHYLEQQLTARAKVIEGKAMPVLENVEVPKEGASDGG